MPYTLTEANFKYAEPYLDEILSSEEDTISWEVSYPRDFAYRLRQAVHCAKKFNYTKYVDILNNFKIKESENRVTATKKVTYKVNPVGIHRKSFDGVSNLSGLVTSAITNSHLTILQFPDLQLSEEDLIQLGKFCRAKGWAYNLERKELQKCQPIQKESENP
jgi:hypothetical protein